MKHRHPDLRSLSLLVVLGLLALVRSSAFSISGIPDRALHPDGFALILSSENDNFGASLGEDWDDLRTFSFNLELFIAGDIPLLLAYDALTNREGAPDYGRIDELTLTVGKRLRIYGDGTHQLDSLLGFGARVYGRMGGEEVQLLWHRVLGLVRPTDLSYESSTVVDFLFYMAAGWEVRSGANLSRYFPLFPPGEAAFGLGANALVTLRTDVQAALDVSVLLRGRSSLIKAAMVYYNPLMQLDSKTVKAVGEFERGFWLSGGVYVGGIFSRYDLNLNSLIGNGTFGLSFGSPYGKDIDRVEQVLINELGLAVKSYMLINQIRWQPVHFRKSDSFASRLFMSLDFRSGTGPRLWWPEYKVRFDQYAAGVTLQLFPLRRGLQLNPFVSILLGIRNESLSPLPNGRAAPIRRAVYPIIQGELGVRLIFSPLFSSTKNILYSIGLATDGFLELPIFSSDSGRFYSTAVSGDLNFSLRFAVISLE